MYGISANSSYCLKQTIPLDCKVGEYVSIARQAFDGQWYIGCMTNSDSRELSIKLDFYLKENIKSRFGKMA